MKSRLSKLQRFANPSAVVGGTGNLRYCLAVLASGSLRFERSLNSIFEDRVPTLAINRNNYRQVSSARMSPTITVSGGMVGRVSLSLPEQFKRKQASYDILSVIAPGSYPIDFSDTVVTVEYLDFEIELLRMSDMDGGVKMNWPYAWPQSQVSSGKRNWTFSFLMLDSVKSIRALVDNVDCESKISATVEIAVKGLAATTKLESILGDGPQLVATYVAF
ncbi:hypothetical protein V1506DRAFT_517156 [Lipomyces tetrasporus]